MDGYSISHPKLVEHFRRIAEREGIPHQMEILPSGGTDAGGVQRLHGGIPAVTISIPCRYVHTPNEMVSSADVEAAITLLARSEEHTSELQSRQYLVCRLLLEKKNINIHLTS